MVRLEYSLADLHQGEAGTIRDIAGSSPAASRLLDLGFLPGTPVKALGSAPTGDPTMFLIRGYRIGLRQSESRQVRLEPRPNE